MSWYALVALGVFVGFVAGQLGYMVGVVRTQKRLVSETVEAYAEVARLSLLVRKADLEAQSVYHLLDTGHVMQLGDETIDDDGLNWIPVDGWAIGRTYQANLYKSVRRLGPWVAPLAQEVDPQ